MEHYTKIANELSGEASDQEDLEAWRKNKPENEQEYRHMLKIWKGARIKEEEFQPDVEKAWLKVLETMEEGESTRTIGFLKISFLKIAASVLFVLALPALYMLSGNFGFGDNNDMTYITKIGEIAEVVLPDGTKVWINENSRLSIAQDYGEETRNVVFLGEAYFEVEKDKDRPFRIEAGTGVVEVIGTSFNIESGETVKVNVTSGTVALYGKDNIDEKLVLQKGEGGLLQEMNLFRSEYKNENFLAWKTGKMVFITDELSQIAESLEKYYRRTVHFETAELAKCRITTTFHNISFEEAIEIISLTMNLDAEFTDNGVILKGKTCNF